MFPKYFSKSEGSFFNIDDDPLRAQKNMVNNIQQFIGIRNVFGDKGIPSKCVQHTKKTTKFCGT